MLPDTGDSEKTRIVGIGLSIVVLIGTVAGGLALVAASQSAAPGDASEQPAAEVTQSGPALVRFVHASPDALPVNITIDDQQVLSNVSFGTVSDYLRVAPGEHTVTVTEYSNLTEGDVLFEGTVTVEADTNYTVAAAGEVTAGDGGLQPIVLVDNATMPSENESTVRLTHLSPDAPAVDVTVEGTDTVLFDDLDYRNSSGYVTVPAGNYTLEVRPATANDSGEVVATFDVSLQGATAYEAFAIGYLNPDEAIVNASFDLVVAEPTVSEPSPGTMITPEPDETETPTETGGNETAG